MRICLVLEGSYPYVMGGVSNWTDEIVRSMPEHEFIIWTIGDKEERRGKFMFDLPANVVEVNENFLDSALKMRVNRNHNVRYPEEEKRQIDQLIRCQSPDWEILLKTFSNKKINPLELFMSMDFLEILKGFCEDVYPYVGFADIYWTIRSMFLPLLFLLTKPIPQADVYHSVCTGYAGVLGAIGAMKNNKPYIVSEHGIYTREREEEILRADWVVSYLKDLWIEMFYMYSRFAYQQAWRVTSLFERASQTQKDLGCPPEKCDVIGNGINVNAFSSIPPKKENGWIDIAAIVRIAPIKDIKTMIYTFSRLKQEIENVRLHILGGFEDETYYQECKALIKYLGVKDISMPGIVDIKKYLKKIDFTLLTSISEGQPYAILESMAAGRPLVATDVGSCRELIEGEYGDSFGPAGIYAPPMHQALLLDAMIKMCRNKIMRTKMGLAGQKRVSEFHRKEKMVNDVLDLYKKAVKTWQV